MNPVYVHIQKTNSSDILNSTALSFIIFTYPTLLSEFKHKIWSCLLHALMKFDVPQAMEYSIYFEN